MTPIPYADLVVSAVSADADRAAAASRCSCRWTVANQSPQRHRHDQHRRVVRHRLAWRPTRPARTSSPASGASTTSAPWPSAAATRRTVQRHAARRPAAGTYYVVVKTGGPYEFIYTDNNTAVGGPVVVTLTPAPDLTPTHLEVTTPGFDGRGDRRPTPATRSTSPGPSRTSAPATPTAPGPTTCTCQQVGGTRQLRPGSVHLPQPARRPASPTRDASRSSFPPTSRASSSSCADEPARDAPSSRTAPPQQ